MSKKSISTTRMVQARSHYPENFRTYKTPPYRKIIFADPQVDRSAVTFYYDISYTVTKFHCNPPIWEDIHPHDFKITLSIKSIRYPEDMYGIDTVEVEKVLKFECELLPNVINEVIPSGTTEDICLYFSSLKLPDKNSKIIRISVSETPERTTILEV